MVFTAAQIELSRRDLVTRAATLVALTALAGRGIGTASARAGAPEAGGNPFADLGLPELAVMITDTGYEGVPAELTAGRYVLAVTNAITAPNPDIPDILDFAGAGLLKVPAEFTVEELLAMMTAPPALESGSTDAGPEGSGPPPWYYETTLGGGPFARRGETDYAVIDLTAGDWILWGEDPAAPRLLAGVRVTGDLPADLAAPSGSKRVEMSDFAFAIDPLQTGRQTIELTNVGVQPHFLGLTLVPDGTTVEDSLALFATLFGDPSATSPANLSADDLRIVLDSAAQSAGVTAWHSVDLVAGTYAAVCFIIDPATGLPHTMLGMAQLVVVA
ncbi:MAG: hypothetical protein M3464_02745 [Chloroflexota bacterium]|nr:hypothetical protein [Chloroflexota bacterium]